MGKIRLKELSCPLKIDSDSTEFFVPLLEPRAAND